MLTRERGLTRGRGVTSQNILTFSTHRSQNAGNVLVAGLSTRFKAFHSPPQITCILDTVLRVICEIHSVYFPTNYKNYFVMENVCAVCEVRFEILCAFAKFRKVAISILVCPSVPPHRTTRLPLDWFPRNLIFVYFSKICLENLTFVKIWQE